MPNLVVVSNIMKWRRICRIYEYFKPSVEFKNATNAKKSINMQGKKQRAENPFLTSLLFLTSPNDVDLQNLC